jgi:DNA-binding HxlR family transcriptional regulator
LIRGDFVAKSNVFVTPERLKDLIIKYVKEEERSISSLSRRLEAEGHKMHRLVLTGYLKALTDVGVLKEKEIPPAKVYTTSAHREKNVYETVGEKCRALKLSDDERAEVAVYILQKLFHRPVFFEELKQAGFKEGVDDAEQITGDERREAKAALTKSKVHLPYNDPAYLVKKDYDDVFAEVLSDIITETFRARRLVVGTKQLKLGEV